MEVLPNLVGVQGETDLEFDMVLLFVKEAAFEIQGVAGGLLLRAAGLVFGGQDFAADQGELASPALHLPKPVLTS